MMINPTFEHCARIVLPWRAVPDQNSAARLVRDALHVVFWVALLAALWFVNRQANLERFLRSPWPWAHGVWLPVLGLIIYATAWLGRGLWLALAEDRPLSAWPDLDAAWSQTKIALVQAGVRVSDTPLYLILGPLNPELKPFLESSGATSATNQPTAAFHVFARGDAILVACANLSQLGMNAGPGHQGERLRHLCGLIAADRPRTLALQGIVIATPFHLASDVVRRCQHDLFAVRQALGLDVPLFFALTGTNELSASNGAGVVRFPLSPDLDPAEVLAMFQTGVAWTCASQSAELRAGLHLDNSANEPGVLPSLLRENIERYQHLSSFELMKPRLVQLLVEGTRNEYAEPGMIAGCYFLSNTAAGQALWHDLAQHREHGTFTPTVIAHHAEVRRRMRLAYWLMGLVVFGGLAGLGFVLWRVLER